MQVCLVASLFLFFFWKTFPLDWVLHESLAYCAKPFSFSICSIWRTEMTFKWYYCWLFPMELQWYGVPIGSFSYKSETVLGFSMVTCVCVCVWLTFSKISFITAGSFTFWLDFTSTLTSCLFLSVRHTHTLGMAIKIELSKNGLYLKRYNNFWPADQNK